MSTGSSTQVTRRGVLPRLRDARIRAKLALILFVPLVAVVALAGVRLIDVGQRASAAATVQKLTALGTDISALTQLMHVERMAAAAYLSTPQSPVDPYNAAIKRTDAQIQVYFTDRRALGSPPDTVQERLNRIDDHLNTMDATRSKVTDRNGLAVAEAVSRYSVVITDLVSYGDAVSQYAGDGVVANGLRAVAAFAKAKAGTADQEAISYAARAANDVSTEQRTAFIATQTSQQEALQSFTLVATPAQQALVNGVVTGDAVNLADAINTQLARGELVAPGDITQSLGSVVDLMRWAEQQLESQVLKQARADRDSVVRQAATEATLVVLVLLIAIALAVILARSLNMSLRRLREGALSVANRDLPEAVARLRDARNLGEGGADDIVRDLRDPIQLTNRDEIGQVAQAFNVVHREAVRIAAEQAALRTSVSTMFLNLARRSQSLVDRMIGELDQIERTEEDPKRLARLFELDHLATRMRRNDENLLVLAGADSSAPRREDALLVDALRAAQSEIELYNRIEFGTVDTDIGIIALAVNDVVRLVAELLDNATRFSPPTTIVVADARRIRDYVVVQVEDRGLGMSEEHMDQLNLRLTEPPGVDVAAFRLMGLAVVGRLAARYGIRVELRANLEGGTVAQIILPTSIVVLPNRRPESLRSGRAPELSGPSGAWDTVPSRSATATLPALSPEPWREPAEPIHPQLPMFPSQRPPSTAAPVSGQPLTAAPVSGRPLPGLPMTAAPVSGRPLSGLPMAGQALTGQTVGLPQTQPTPDRPPLPTRVSRPIPSTSTMNGFTAPTAAMPAVAAEPSAFATPPSGQPFGGPPASGTLPASPLVGPSSGIPSSGIPSSGGPAFGGSVPTAARPSPPDGNGWGAALAAMPPVPPPPTAAPVEDRTESPIFVEMQQSWFKDHDGTGPQEWGMPTAGYAPPPTSGGSAPEPAVSARSATPAAPASAPPATGGSVPASAAPSTGSSVPASAAPATGSSVPASTATGQNGSVPKPRPAAEDRWKTAADDGWKRAMAAAEPIDAGTTRSGLPKRVPQAQLVPGGVQNGPRTQNRRTPDEVRGLLSAYHRGVQRGRTDGSAEATTAFQAKEKDQ